LILDHNLHRNIGDLSFSFSAGDWTDEISMKWKETVIKVMTLMISVAETIFRADMERVSKTEKKSSASVEELSNAPVDSAFVLLSRLVNFISCFSHLINHEVSGLRKLQYQIGHLVYSWLDQLPRSNASNSTHGSDLTFASQLLASILHLQCNEVWEELNAKGESLSSPQHLFQLMENQPIIKKVVYLHQKSFVISSVALILVKAYALVMMKNNTFPLVNVTT
jgi:hypothetical protein